jgi:hypothetical protein
VLNLEVLHADQYKYWSMITLILTLINLTLDCNSNPNRVSFCSIYSTGEKNVKRESKSSKNVDDEILDIIEEEEEDETNQPVTGSLLDVRVRCET